MIQMFGSRHRSILRTSFFSSSSVQKMSWLSSTCSESWKSFCLFVSMLRIGRPMVSSDELDRWLYNQGISAKPHNDLYMVGRFSRFACGVADPGLIWGFDLCPGSNRECKESFLFVTGGQSCQEASCQVVDSSLRCLVWPRCETPRSGSDSSRLLAR